MRDNTHETTCAAVFTDEVLSRAAELARDSYQPVWTGASGEESTGESVARHLEAAAALLETDGWTRTSTYTSPASTKLPAIESMSTQAMVREVLRAIREETAPGPRTLSVALDHTARGEDGDTDTRDVAYQVLNRVVRALTGHDQAHATAWTERLHRTREDVLDLLAAGARFARTYGPGATAAPEAA
ncbi:DUF6197 family protein [Streptomyces vietnamensis]|uniref:Uncharacterized protein n=1 Tax=Streptomyces vietnamensis TaxID=362257 RepID=A0A0B5I8T3_9ACTN|nr:hypothetical protein [Streptomyces vietnamensis]AJF70435.1 hypothetical protein SVTN_40390 [Streptomyces vietnamensis]